MRSILTRCLPIAIVLTVVAGWGGVAAQTAVPEFSGDVVITKADSTTVLGRIYVHDPRVHRFEITPENGGEVYLKPSSSRGRIWILNPANKQFRVIGPGFATRTEPWTFWTDYRNDMRGGTAGTDTISGFSCTVYEFKYSEEDPITARWWVADTLMRPIRIEADTKIAVGVDSASAFIYEPVAGTLEIRNIKLEDLPDSLFVVPEDYTETE